MRWLVMIVTLFSFGCCTSLPRLDAKRVAFPAPAAQSERIVETSEVFRDDKRQRDVPVKFYAPANATSRLPVVVFSHGIGENRDSYAYLGRALANAGFLAIHITHAGTDRAVLERGYRHLYRAVKQKENWVARPLDVSFVLDRIASRSDVDMDRIAIAGHSAGAFTAFAIAGLRMS
ncbi:MAG TPA: acetylxylan esterase, partial [Thermoanaerobaculia bacterium]